MESNLAPGFIFSRFPRFGTCGETKDIWTFGVSRARDETRRKLKPGREANPEERQTRKWGASMQNKRKIRKNVYVFSCKAPGVPRTPCPNPSLTDYIMLWSYYDMIVLLHYYVILIRWLSYYINDTRK